jgi:hypothetical protein
MATPLSPSTIYANLMEEAKARIAAVDAAINGRINLPDMILEEFVYLQLRLLCEIIALGCLVAHGDLTQSKITKLRDAYDADTIVKTLETLNPTFYPLPVKLTIRPPGPGDPGEVRIDDVPKGTAFLTKKDLLAIYGRTGNYLHRGKLRKLESRPPYTGVDLPTATEWAKKFVRLLDQHKIQSPDNKKGWLCGMNDPQGKVMLAIIQAP